MRRLIVFLMFTLSAWQAHAQFLTNQPGNMITVPPVNGYPNLYSPQGEFLGNLNPNQFDANSVYNQFGKGNPFLGNGVNNQFSPNYVGRRF